MDENCPRSMNHRPDDFPAKDCIMAGECGCEYGMKARQSGYLIGLREAADIARRTEEGCVTYCRMHEVIAAAIGNRISELEKE